MRIQALVLATLLLSVPAAAQEPLEGIAEAPFALQAPFEAGERWSTCGGLRMRVTRIGWPAMEGSIAWTHSVQVVARPHGFALRGTLTSLVWEERLHGVQTVRSWSADAPGPLADPAARTWTYGFDRTWALLDVDGPEQSIQRLLDRLRPDAGDAVATELNRQLARRAAEGVERFLLAASAHLGQPVRAAMASLSAGPLVPGRSWTLEPLQGPPGRSRYLGLEGTAGHFEATWQVEGERALQARFVLDVHGRLRWMNVQHAELLPVEGGTLRAVHELAFGVIRVEGEEPAWTPALLVR